MIKQTIVTDDFSGYFLQDGMDLFLYSDNGKLLWKSWTNGLISGSTEWELNAAVELILEQQKAIIEVGTIDSMLKCVLDGLVTGGE